MEIAFFSPELSIQGQWVINVAQASFRWRKLVNQLQDSPLPELNLPELNFAALSQLPLPHLGKAGGWIVGLTGTAALLYWDGKLLLATGTGVLMMLSVHLLHESKWKVPSLDLRRWLSGANRQLVVAVGCGGVATLSTYLAASIWSDSGSGWIAIGEILQGAGIAGILGILLWQMGNRRSMRDEAYFNQLLSDLTDADPLKRLIAVRQITHLTTSRRLESDRDRPIADYFRLMLSREEESIIRDAVLEGLYELDTINQLAQSQQPNFSAPLIRRSSTKVRRQTATKRNYPLSES
ncbi:MAG: hypothetical protein KME16_17920 [Scytolyngbya sp. HA4215-MV1]|jgi:hypothetical protein|nr:hypothetical protein [Scytolyngbya sp. HA4215-MV1]